MPKKEQIFLTELRHTFDRLGAFWHKIPDMPIYKGTKTRFSVPKPFDAFAMIRGKPIAIEAKYMPDYKSFGVSQIRESQFQGLNDFQSAGGEAYVFLNIRRKASKEKKLQRLNRLIIFDWHDLRSREKNLTKSELLLSPYCEGEKGQFDLSFVYARIARPLMLKSN